RRKLAGSIGPVLCLTIAFSAVVGVSAFSLQENDEEEGRFERPYGRYAYYSRQFDPAGTIEVATRSFEKSKQLLLDPGVFDRLSAGGKRAVLKMTGMLPLERKIKPYSLQEQSGIEPMIAMPGDNVRVNDPKIDGLDSTQSETGIAVRGPNIVVGFNNLFKDTSGYA